MIITDEKPFILQLSDSNDLQGFVVFWKREKIRELLSFIELLTY